MLLALSFMIIYQTGKFFHIAHAVTITLGAYLVYCFSTQCNFNFILSIIISIALSTSLACLLELGIYRQLRRLKVQSFNLMIVSLGLYTVLQNIISMIWHDDSKSFRTKAVSIGHEVMGAYITDVQILSIVICLVLFILTVLFLDKSSIGKRMNAVSSNSSLSSILGINADMSILWAFILGSLLASVVGVVVASDTDMNPTMGFNLLLYAMVVMIIGGIGSYSGLVKSAILLASVQHISSFFIDSKWMDLIAYLILIVFLAWKPLGFSGQRLKKNTL